MSMKWSVVGAALVMGLSAASPSLATVDHDSRIYQAPASAFPASKSTRFGINPDLGRAWVELDMFYPVSETADFYRVAVPGLSYDAERSEVVFKANGKRVVCANVSSRGWGIFRHNRIEATGQCELSHRYVSIPVDNGFVVDHIEHFEVHFKPVVSHAGAESG